MESVSGGTYYQILGVLPSAGPEDLKNQYRKLALKLHPDKNRDDPDATQKFQELQEAYEVLSDPERRIAYDQNSDFILRAFAEGSSGGDDNQRESFLSVPSSRTMWCLMVEAAFGDDGKTVAAYANQLEDEIFMELCQGGVCGFTLLHFAAFAGKSRACQALIELGANVNAKTQPLCVTPSQQFCRPTPIDLTVFITNKKAREATIRVLLNADAQKGGVDLDKLENVWKGLIRHQLLLIRDEVLKFTQKIPTSVRRVLRTDDRWREVVHFPGEDAASIEKRRTKRNMRIWRSRIKWVLWGESTDSFNHRWGVRFGNFLIFLFSWWLFGFDKFQLIATFLIAMIFMCCTSAFRLIPVEEYQKAWEKVPTKEQIREALPSQEQLEDWAQQAKVWLEWAWVQTQEAAVFSQGEYRRLRDAGASLYFEEAKMRAMAAYTAYQEARAAAENPEGEEDEDDNGRSEKAKKKSAGIGQRIAKMLSAGIGGGGGGGGGSGGDRPRGMKGKRRRG